MLTERITVIRLTLKNEKKKYMSMLQLQFQNEVKVQRKVTFIQTRVYHTQNNALHKRLTKLILSQQASGYAQTPESVKQYIPNTSYSNFRKTTNKINRIEIIM
jgi:hypothetical protein